MPRFLTIFVIACAWICSPSGHASSDSVHQKNRATLDAWLKTRLETSSIQIEPKIVPIADTRVQVTFRKYEFFGVYMPRWPRAITPPEGLSYETIVVLSAGEFVAALRGDDELKSFLAKSLTEVTTESKAGIVAEAALVLLSYGSSNGPFELNAPVISASRGETGILATAQAEVREPARGHIKVALQFDNAGLITADAITIESAARSKPPPR